MNDGSSRDSSGDYSDINKQNTALVTQHLVEEIRQAVNEANARGIDKIFCNVYKIEQYKSLI